ncbi:MAG: nicotinate-nucleotide--dimethylbenzimidazole phosphoribosyltransferase [Verrucomicrobia bacterium]|nr:nicotinate-nucleotide--dimethylbenzimidazole phosphoribosyltransferase [Verrucomicrobiota bacterium]
MSPETVRAALDAKTKPPGSLGRLEELAVRIAVLQETLRPRLDRPHLITFAANHGVVEEGVSAYPRAVTAQMVANFRAGGAAISVLAREAGISHEVIDAGVEPGTRNFTRESAMTGAECAAAMGLGRDAVGRAIGAGADAIGIGEMGIGNTTAAAALFAGWLDLDPALVTGAGTGVAGSALARKREVVRAGVRRHAECRVDPGRWLAAVGGLEIAAMSGAILEAHRRRTILVVDGYIATAAAMMAFAMQPESREVCFFAHQSAELGHPLILERLGARPLLSLGLRLGEGTGAVLAMPLLRSAAAILREMATFASAGVSPGEA